MSLRHLALAAVCAAAFSAPAFADTTVTILHVSEDKTTQALWEQIAKDYEAAHPGVKVEVKYLENEAFKAKLPTMLQSDNSRPEPVLHLGRRRHGRAGQGRLPQGRERRRRAASRPIWRRPRSTSIKVDGKAVGVPFEQGDVSFFYNKKLFEKAGVKAEDIKSWDDFLGRGEEAQGRRASRRSRSAPARNGRCTSTIPIS